MEKEECWHVWEVLPLSSSSEIVLSLKVAGAATFIAGVHKPQNEEQSITHKARLIA